MDAFFRHLSLPGKGIDMHLVPQLHAFARDAQHVALDTAERKILENDEGKLHAAGIQEKDELYAKIAPDSYSAMQTTTISIRAISFPAIHPADFKLDGNTYTIARIQHIGLQQPHSTLFRRL
jgi:hypothetical protein